MIERVTVTERGAARLMDPRRYSAEHSFFAKTPLEAFKKIGIHIQGAQNLTPEHVLELFKSEQVNNMDIVKAFRVSLLDGAFNEYKEPKDFFIDSMKLIAEKCYKDFTYPLLQQLNEAEHIVVSLGMAKALSVLGNVISPNHVETIRASFAAGINSLNRTSHSIHAKELKNYLDIYNGRVQAFLENDQIRP